MSRLTGGFAKILKIAEEDELSKYSEQLLETLIRVNWASRDGPWFFNVSAILLKEVYLNGTRIAKGGHLWFRKVKLKPISHI